MRLNIRHTTRYSYETPATYAMQVLRLTPRSHDGQYVRNWRIDINVDCKLTAVRDPFGNLTHTFSVDGPIEDLEITAVGEVETYDTAGVVAATRERLPQTLYMRDTPLTGANTDMKLFADAVAERGLERLPLLHALNKAVHERIEFETDATHAATTATEAFASGRGVCQDLTHVFLACCRHLGVPARYAGGYMFRADGENHQEAGHAWAEAFVEDIGWVGFDPAHGMCPTDAYIRVAVGLDFLSASPIRGARYGGTEEKMTVLVAISDLDMPQSQRQDTGGQSQVQQQ